MPDTLTTITELEALYGRILAALSHDRVGGERYDREWPGRAAQTMW